MTAQYVRESMSLIISPPLSFGESRFDLAMTLIEPSLLKKVCDTSQRNLSTVFTFISELGD